MKQKTVLITGANRGIGKAISHYFASKDYQLIIITRNKNNIQEFLDDLYDSFPYLTEIKIYECDLGDSFKLASALNSITKNFENIDVLVNNAGIYKSGTEEGQIDEFKEVMDVNITAPMQIIKSIVPIMKQQQSGYIFNVASRAGKIGFANSGTYSSSKFALVGLSESLYRALASENIKVTALCPSYVNTSMAIDAGAEIDPKEMIQPVDLANTIDYLLGLSPAALVKEVVIECRYAVN